MNKRTATPEEEAIAKAAVERMQGTEVKSVEDAVGLVQSLPDSIRAGVYAASIQSLVYACLALVCRLKDATDGKFGTDEMPSLIEIPLPGGFKKLDVDKIIGGSAALVGMSDDAIEAFITLQLIDAVTRGRTMEQFNAELQREQKKD